MNLIIKHITNSSLQFSLQKWQISFLWSFRRFKTVMICRLPLAKPFAEIATYKKHTNAVFQYFNHTFRPFSFANPFAENQTLANKCKPVFQLVKTENTLFLCNASLQKP